MAVMTWRETPQLSESDFLLFQRLVKERAQITLGDNKAAMLRARLGKLVRRGGHKSFRRYYRHLLEDGTGAALQEFLNAVTTNKTSFFREVDHFEFLLDWPFSAGVAPKVWSAGCSSGEEPYSLAITFMEREAPPLRAKILATDISSKVLGIAQAGTYPMERLPPMPRERLRRYFLRGQGASAGKFRVKPSVAECVRFQPHNLRDPIGGEAPFDVIFCRNVMIYFDRPFQEALARRFAAALAPAGLLFVGHAESFTGFCPPELRSLGQSIYQRIP